MRQSTILVVEDETIVAKDLQQTLSRLGYNVPVTATSGEEAVHKAEERRPDLALMDIILKGPMDGVETAQALRRRFDIPIVYLTAYADDHTLQRAKDTAPAGYLLKPFQPGELRPTIEMALCQSQRERHMNASLRWLETAMQCVEDAVITTDRSGCITDMNRTAEFLTGWDRHVAIGYSLEALLPLSRETACGGIFNAVLQAMAEGRVVIIDDRVLRARDGAHYLIQGRAVPVVTGQGGIIGAVVAFHLLADQPVRQFRDPDRELTEGEGYVSYSKGVVNLCAWCKRVPDGFGAWYDLHTFITERSGVQFNGGLCPDCMEQCFPEHHITPTT
jgi:PAS domain S-box-containing protein